MNIEHGKFEGDIQLDQELIFHGMITGTITVVDVGILSLHGVCCQDIIVEECARVYLHGTANGNVVNRGGHLEVYGTIGGSLHTVKGNTFVDPNAIVKGGK